MAVSMYVCEDMMETRQMTLTEFLLARLAEDEAVARESYEAVPPAFGAYGRLMLDAIDYLIVDPARVLAECETKRRIVAWCSERDRVYIGTLATDIPREKDFVPGALVHQTDAIMLRFLALPYADHEHFQEEWRP